MDITAFVESLKDPKMLDDDGPMPESTWDCHLHEFNLPLPPYVVSELCMTWEVVELFIDKHIKDYPFVKTCQFSPKDWVNPSIFKNTKDAMLALKNSSRCLLNRHIVMKKQRAYNGQSRIYYAGGNPRVVCGNLERKLVDEFIETHKYDIPFNYCCVEIGLCTVNDKLKVELIEINTCTTLCDPAPLDWSQDWEKILFSDKIMYCDV